MEHNDRINTIPNMLIKLDELYKKEEILIKQLQTIQRQYRQLLDDKEFLQNAIMYASNKNSRIVE